MRCFAKGSTPEYVGGQCIADATMVNRHGHRVCGYHFDMSSRLEIILEQMDPDMTFLYTKEEVRVLNGM